jgi:hypothetical protein
VVCTVSVIDSSLLAVILSMGPLGRVRGTLFRSL